MADFYHFLKISIFKRIYSILLHFGRFQIAYFEYFNQHLRLTLSLPGIFTIFIYFMYVILNFYDLIYFSEFISFEQLGFVPLIVANFIISRQFSIDFDNLLFYYFPQRLFSYSKWHFIAWNFIKKFSEPKENFFRQYY